MIRALTLLARTIRRFRSAENGNGTIEFVLVLPAFMLLFTSAYEAGVLGTRHVMLERAVDMTVREVRIGKLRNPTHATLSQRICEIAKIIPNCMVNLRLEMVSKDPRNWAALDTDVDCVDRAEVGVPVLNINPGQNNELMILRACSLFDPMIPTSGLGKVIPKESQGAYALVATSAYVMEPFQ